MGLLDFWMNEKTSMLDSIVTGTVLGAAIGDKLDERRDRAKIINLLQIQNLQQKKLQDDVDYKLRAEEAENWLWMWKMPGCCAMMYLRYMETLFKNPRFDAIHKRLWLRWEGLSKRAYKVNIAPTLSMPRTISGDIAGTPRLLDWAMDRLETKVGICERYIDMQGKWGEENGIEI